ncbi:MAG: sigma-E processing peptidase SpoIIGA [Firmicutes bacterium]|nr:sigma-E processing peptidase SpoIIGA [Bacillota bacterium]
MEIYADVLFLINFTASYLMLALTAKATRNKAKPARLAAASAAGGALSIACFFAGSIGVVIRLAGGVLMIIISFGAARIVTRTVIFMIMSALVSAAFALIGSIFGEGVISVRNGVAYFDLPQNIFVITFIAAYVLIMVITEVIKRKKDVKIHTLTVRYNGCSVNVKALSDSGNTLKEPVSGKSVVIAEWRTIYPLFDGADYNDLINNMDRYRLRIVPYHSLGNKNGMIFAFLADDIIISDEKRSAGKIYIGITREQLSKTNEYNALIGASV